MFLLVPMEQDFDRELGHALLDERVVELCMRVPLSEKITDIRRALRFIRPMVPLPERMGSDQTIGERYRFAQGRFYMDLPVIDSSEACKIGNFDEDSRRHIITARQQVLLILIKVLVLDVPSDQLTVLDSFPPSVLVETEQMSMAIDTFFESDDYRFLYRECEQSLKR